MSGLRKLALQVTVGGALAGLVAAPASAQWGWQTPTVQPAQAQAPAPATATAPASPGASRGENFSAGKPAAQLFVSDCTGAGCHKGPQGLGKDRGQSSLAGFLREHYTNSRESAAALAAYLVGVPGGTARADPRQPRAAPRSDDAAKPAERKPPIAAAAPSEETSEIAKPEPAKPAAKPPRGRQATSAPPAAAPTPAPEPPAAAPNPAPEPPKPQWDIFD